MENFYNLSPVDYIKATFNADMKKEYALFEKYLNHGDKILDVGFGSGRDMLYFSKKGYDVYGIDIEPEFVNQAQKRGLKVIQQDVNTFKPKEKYDAIWACASLMYATLEELPALFNKLLDMLKPGGHLYASFKYGDWEGYIAEKYYTYLNEEKLEKLHLNIIDKHLEKDNLKRSHTWISFVIEKEK